VYEVAADADAAQDDDGAGGGASSGAVHPITLAVVDAAGPSDFLALVRGGLAVALEALPPGSLFGLIGVSSCISLVDMSGPGCPMLHHLPVLGLAGGTGPVLVPLEDIVPLGCLLVPVEHARTCLAQVGRVGVARAVV
jgi:hypothetical protein